MKYSSSKFKDYYVLEVSNLPITDSNFFEAICLNGYNRDRISKKMIPVEYIQKKQSKVVGVVDSWVSGSLVLRLYDLVSTKELLELIAQGKIDFNTFGTGECLEESDLADPDFYRLEKIYFQASKEKK